MNQPAGSTFLAEWLQLASSLELGPVPAAALGDELLQRHLEPHRSYHTDRHIVAVIEHLRSLESATPTALLAAFFHDAIYDPTSGDNEAQSADLAQARLSELNVDAAIVDDVVAIIVATAGHRLPADPPVDAASFLDADLAILGARPDVYATYSANVRSEYAHMSDEAFRTGRIQVLHHLSALDPLFHTETGRALWDQQARINMQTELAQLRRINSAG